MITSIRLLEDGENTNCEVYHIVTTFSGKPLEMLKCTLKSQLLDIVDRDMYFVFDDDKHDTVFGIHMSRLQAYKLLDIIDCGITKFYFRGVQYGS
jgi:hypothetical protein